MEKIGSFEVDTCGLDDNVEGAVTTLERQVDRIADAVNNLIDSHNEDTASDAAGDDVSLFTEEFKKAIDTNVRFRTALEDIANSDDKTTRAGMRLCAVVALRGAGDNVDKQVDKQVDEAMSLEPTKEDHEEFARKMDFDNIASLEGINETLVTSIEKLGVERDAYKAKFELLTARLEDRTKELGEAYRLLHEGQDGKGGA